jgi:hypothetical protein
MTHEGSLTYSQERIICPYPELDVATPHASNLLPQDPF